MADLEKRLERLESSIADMQVAQTELSREIERHKFEVEKSVSYWIETLKRSPVLIHADNITRRLEQVERDNQLVLDRMNRYSALFGIRHVRALRRWFKSRPT